MYGGGMYGGGMHGGGMYGGGMGGMYNRGGYGAMGMNNQQQDGQQQQQDPNAEYQFDFRRDLQQTVGGLNASLGLAFGLAQMANLGSTTLGYAWRLTKYLFGSIFNMRNITVPLKWLTSLLFGFRYLTKEERRNERLIRETWSELDSGFARPSPSKHATQSKAFNLMRRGRILGLSKFLIKSLIFAIAGVLATLVFRLISRRKQQQLIMIEEEEKRKERELIQQEWDRIEKSKQPMLEITTASSLVKNETQKDNATLDELFKLENQAQKFNLPWSEEESKSDRQKGYDGELTAMTFKHVIGSNVFRKEHPNLDDQILREQSQWLEELKAGAKGSAAPKNNSNNHN